jgi:hypothetical protein
MYRRLGRNLSRSRGTVASLSTLSSSQVLDSRRHALGDRYELSDRQTRDLLFPGRGTGRRTRRHRPRLLLLRRLGPWRGTSDHLSARGSPHRPPRRAGMIAGRPRISSVVRRSVAAALASLLSQVVLVAPASAAAGPTTATVFRDIAGNTDPATYRHPGSFRLASADSFVVFRHLRWRGWGSLTASARGRARTYGSRGPEGYVCHSGRVRRASGPSAVASASTSPSSPTKFPTTVRRSKYRSPRPGAPDR